MSSKVIAHFQKEWQTGAKMGARSIDHLHYDIIHAKTDGSCSRPAETGPSVSLKRRQKSGKTRGSETLLIDEHDKNNVAHGSHGAKCPWRLVYFKNPKTVHCD